jgi:ADP-ribose diphosphatase
MRKLPDILSSEIVARSRLFRVERVHLRFSNAVEVEYERIPGSAVGAVLVVPLLDDDTVLLIREYAAGTQRYELACPKGRVEPGEDHREAANREIMEEIGYGAHHLSHLRSMTVAPGYIGQTTHIYLATELYPRRLPGDEPEEIEVVPWRLSRMDELLARDDFTEARSIAALLLTRERLRAGS